MGTGHDIHRIARARHRRGVLIDTATTQALKETRRLLGGARRPLFEAAFQSGGVLVRADLLLPGRRARWRMLEVKSSSKVKPHHITDAAIQSWVVRRAGLDLSRVLITHVDTSFVYPGGGDYEGLLAHEDITREAADVARGVPGWIRAARNTLDGTDPRTEPGSQCNDPYDCPFIDHCGAGDAGPGHPPEELKDSNIARQLREEGYTDIGEIPAGRLSQPKHVRIWQAVRRNRAILDPAAGDQLRALGQPRYYLDFETIQFAVPIWAGTRPYQQIPFQWSCHVEDAGGRLRHHEFLAADATDPRRAFAESLLRVLRRRGPIFVYYAAFERSRVNELARDFPDLAPALVAVTRRFVDLLPIARDHYYHPRMRGSWSIKAVLPSIAPDLSYDDLEVADGLQAQVSFAEMIAPDTPRERRAQLRDGLRRYCERDTLAMVRIAHHFQRTGHAKK